MVTTLHLKNIAATGTKPSTKQCADTITQDAAAAVGRATYATPYKMLVDTNASGSNTSIAAAEPGSAHYTHLGSWISDTLPAQTISGTLTVVLDVVESSGNCNMYPRIFVYIWTAAGAKGATLYGPATSATEAGTGHSAVTYFNAVSLTTTTIGAGDRIVVEIESYDNNTRTATYTHYLNWTGTATGTTASYLTFSGDLFAAQPVTVTKTAAYRVASTPAPKTKSSTYSVKSTPWENLYGYDQIGILRGTGASATSELMSTGPYAGWYKLTVTNAGTGGTFWGYEYTDQPDAATYTVGVDFVVESSSTSVMPAWGGQDGIGFLSQLGDRWSLWWFNNRGRVSSKYVLFKRVDGLAGATTATIYYRRYVVLNTLVDVGTKSSRYVVAVPTPTTKLSKYAVLTHATPITASGRYAVLSTKPALTKSARYEIGVPSVSYSVTKDGKYAILRTPSPVTKASKYSVRYSQSPATKDSSYAILASHLVTKDGKYSIRYTRPPLTKGSTYYVDAPHIVTKDGRYSVRYVHSPVTKSSEYHVLHQYAVTKTAKYTVPHAYTLTRDGRYSVLRHYVVTKDGKYSIIRTASAATKDSKYAVMSYHALTKSGKYAVQYTHSAVTKTAKYTVPHAYTLTKDGRYSVRSWYSVSKDARYGILSGQSVTKDGKYAVQYTHAPVAKGARYVVIPLGASVVTISKSSTFSVRSTHSPVTKGAKYSVITANGADKDSSYRVLSSHALTKSSKYSLSSVTSLVKQSVFRVLSSNVVAKAARYSLITTPGATTKSSSYCINVVSSLVKAAGYVVLSSHPMTVSAKYVVTPVNQSFRKLSVKSPIPKHSHNSATDKYVNVSSASSGVSQSSSVSGINTSSVIHKVINNSGVVK